jgi:hypothetical protein
VKTHRVPPRDVPDRLGLHWLRAALGVAPQADTDTVTMNYRLGLLGHLAHPALRDSRQTPGNYALLDQIAALQWVSGISRPSAATGPGDRRRRLGRA